VVHYTHTAPFCQALFSKNFVFFYLFHFPPKTQEKPDYLLSKNHPILSRIFIDGHETHCYNVFNPKKFFSK